MSNCCENGGCPECGKIAPNQLEAVMKRIKELEQLDRCAGQQTAQIIIRSSGAFTTSEIEMPVAIPRRDRWDRARRKKENKAARKARRVNR